MARKFTVKVGDIVAWAISVIIALMLLMMIILSHKDAHAEDIVLRHVPEGELIEIAGEQYMAYDEETFIRLIAIDQGYSACLLDNELTYQELDAVMATLETYERLLEEQREAFENLREQNDRLIDKIHQERRQSLLHPIHTPIQVVLAGIAVWAIAQR